MTESGLTPYARELARRRETKEIEQLANFGIAVGWVFALLGGFCWFCVVSRIDWFWVSMMTAGLVLLIIGTVLPQVLYWPHRLWMGAAHVQGRLVMAVLLTIVYFTLIWPLGWWERKRRPLSNPFHSWVAVPTSPATGWQPLIRSELSPARNPGAKSGSRSLIRLFGETLAFFAHRGHYLMLPILVILLLLGLIMFFVQTSVLAPFIYTI